MKMFRAIPSDSKVLEKNIRHNTARLPSNVPYFVDNLWEFFRPTNKPSRRFAVYASPTVELALKNASQSKINIAYELKFANPVRFTQLSVTDARYHPDIRVLQKFFNEIAYKMSLKEKQMISILFIPGISKLEIEENINEKILEVLDCVRPLITIWNDMSIKEGEFFFEIDDDNYYTLTAL